MVHSLFLCTRPPPPSIQMLVYPESVQNCISCHLTSDIKRRCIQLQGVRDTKRLRSCKSDVILLFHRTTCTSYWGRSGDPDAGSASYQGDVSHSVSPPYRWRRLSSLHPPMCINMVLHSKHIDRFVPVTGNMNICRHLSPDVNQLTSDNYHLVAAGIIRYKPAVAFNVYYTLIIYQVIQQCAVLFKLFDFMTVAGCGQVNCTQLEQTSLPAWRGCNGFRQMYRKCSPRLTFSRGHWDNIIVVIRTSCYAELIR